MDVRDKTTWVALELTKAGEAKAIEGTLASALRTSLSVPESFQVFVPYASYSKGGRKVSVRLIEGYSFVASGLAETRYFALERGPLVERVMSAAGPHNLRTLQTVSDDKIQGMKDQIRSQISSEIEIGAYVKVINGNYMNLEGEVVDLLSDKAAIRIRLRSLDIIAWLPKIFIDATSNTSEDSNLDIDPLDLAVGSEFLPEN